MVDEYSTPEIPTKTCTKCGETKPETAFSFKRTQANPHARCARCKTCCSHQNRQWRTDHREHLQAYKARPEIRLRDNAKARNRYAANPEPSKARQRLYNGETAPARRAYARAYAAAHPEERRTSNRTYRLENGEELRAKSRRRYAENPAPAKHYQQQYRKEHPEKTHIFSARKRARKADASVNDLSTSQILEIFEAFDFRCAYCQRRTKRLTLDHVTPYVHNGSNTLWNVVPACRSCNSKKGRGKPLIPVQPLLLTIAKPFKKRTSRP